MEFVNKVKEVCGAALSKGKEFGKIAKINIDIVTMESKIGDYKKQIGNLVYNNKLLMDNEEIKNIILKIDTLFSDIELKKKEKKDL